jgi:hypothetical protein
MFNTPSPGTTTPPAGERCRWCLLTGYALEATMIADNAPFSVDQTACMESEPHPTAARATGLTTRDQDWEKVKHGWVCAQCFQRGREDKWID